MALYNMDRPLVVFDIESTGINPRADRIVELAAVKIHPNGAREERHWMIKPGIPIPVEAIAVHGITNEAVADCPTFPELAGEISDFFKDCDLGGFNHVRFDVPMLDEEFRRAGIRFDMDSPRMIDAQRIFHKREPRDLTAALKLYCGEASFDEAHGALADTKATIRVLEGEFDRYTDLPRDPDELNEMLNPTDPMNVDRSRKLRWVKDPATGEYEVAINFGKNQGKTLKEMVRSDRSFLKWMLASDFPRDTKDVIDGVLDGHWPKPPAV